MNLISLAAISLFALFWMGVGMAVRARRKRKQPKKRVKLIHSINDDRCIACDGCIDVCPTNVLELVNHKTRAVRFDDCINCNQCETACPTRALVMHLPTVPPPPVKLPLLDNYYQAQPGLYLIGEAAGKPLVKNASNLGRAVVEHMVASGVKPRPGEGAVDVLIVGSGPGGLSAALSCLERGLSHLVLEKDELLASTIARYPKGKHVMAEPMDGACRGLLPVWDGPKEELLAAWTKLIGEKGVQLALREAVEEVKRDAQGGFVVTSTRADGSKRETRAQRVVLAIGTRGKPRKLGVPGEHLSKVTALLRDPDEHRGQHVLVVGGGDSAVEAAVALAGVAKAVTLSYRGKALSRCKAANRKALEDKVASGKLKAVFGSTVAEINEQDLVLKVGEAARTLRNDHVIAAIGGDAPVKWLEKIGVEFLPQPHMFQRGATDALVDSLIGPPPERPGHAEEGRDEDRRIRRQHG